MTKDPLLINKIAAAILVAGLLGMVSAELASALYNTHEEHGEEAAQAFVIAEPTEGTDVAAAPADAAPAGPGDILPMLASADVGKGEKVAKKCVACHDFTPGGPHKVGPNLYGLLNEPQGQRDGFSYSDAVAGLGGTWSYDELNHFLYDPSGYAPGTKMSFKGVRKDEDRADLIAYLRTLAQSPAPLP
ncbi:cytochrome c family protein [Rhodospirillaceae bacterium KN72]|uniref:Cytochrome c family protein n=1 Tax=Pacificispira spongiicola TaxID=2729598 RepID=A0A7Y0DYB6_9PROT|nr:cytochrome c family protein [Pacificispira spongiicola]NMM43830.1 cytochrome c family protein [Pacificispira spongiicola]